MSPAGGFNSACMASTAAVAQLVWSAAACTMRGASCRLCSRLSAESMNGTRESTPSCTALRTVSRLTVKLSDENENGNENGNDNDNDQRHHSPLCAVLIHGWKQVLRHPFGELQAPLTAANEHAHTSDVHASRSTQSEAIACSPTATTQGAVLCQRT